MHVRTIAIVNEKGGTAKTTSTVNLAAALGRLGHRTLVVDLDGQAASSRWLGVEDDSRLAEALVRGGGLEPIAECRPNLDLAPACGKIDSIAHELRPTQGGQLRRVLSELSGRYDFVLIDCPPSMGNRLIGNAMLAADEALVPVETSILALDGLRLLLTMLGDVRDGFGHDIRLLGVVACRYDARTRLSRLVLAELQRALPEHVFASVIRSNVRLQECPAAQMTIFDYAAQSSAATDYMALAQEVLAGVPAGRAEPKMDGQAAPVDESAYAELDQADRNTLQAFRERAATHLGKQRRHEKAEAPKAEAKPEPIAPPETKSKPDSDSESDSSQVPASSATDESTSDAPEQEAAAEVANTSAGPRRASTALAASVAVMCIGLVGWLVARQLSGGAQPAPAAETLVTEIAPMDDSPSPPQSAQKPTPAPTDPETQDDASPPPEAKADDQATEPAPGDPAAPAPAEATAEPDPAAAPNNDTDAPDAEEYLSQWAAAAERLTIERKQVASTKPAEPAEPNAAPNDDSAGGTDAEAANASDASLVVGPDGGESDGRAMPFADAVLSGTMLGKDGGSAIINGRVVRHGQTWRGAELVDVLANAAVLQRDGKRYRLSVGAKPVKVTDADESSNTQDEGKP